MTKSLRVAAKAAKTSAAHKRAAAAEASQPHPANTSASGGSQHQHATSVAGSRGASPRDQSYSLTTLVSRMTYTTQSHLRHSWDRPGVISRLRIVRRGAVVRWVN